MLRQLTEEELKEIVDYVLSELKKIRNEISNVTTTCELAEKVVELYDTMINAKLRMISFEEGFPTIRGISFEMVEEGIGDNVQHYAKYVTEVIDKAINNLQNVKNVYDVEKITFEVREALEKIEIEGEKYFVDVIPFHMAHIRDTDKGFEGVGLTCKTVQLPLEVAEMDDAVKITIPELEEELYDITVIVFRKRREVKLDIMTTKGRDVRTIKVSKDICSIKDKKENGKIVILLKRCKEPILEEPDEVSERVFRMSGDEKLATEVYKIASDLYYAKGMLRDRWDLWDALRTISMMLRRNKRKTVVVVEKDVYKLPDDKAKAVSQKLLQLIVEIYGKLAHVQTLYEVDLILDMLSENFVNIVREAGL